MADCFELGLSDDSGMSRIGLIIVMIALAGPAWAQQQVYERVHERRLCGDFQTEVTVGAQMRADCITDTHAIEIDFAEHWKEGIGQSLAYAAATGLRPGLILICRQSEASCLASSLGAEQTLGSLGIGSTLWLCHPTDEQLETCRRVEIGQ